MPTTVWAAIFKPFPRGNPVWTPASAKVSQKIHMRWSNLCRRTITIPAQTAGQPLALTDKTLRQSQHDNCWHGIIRTISGRYRDDANDFRWYLAESLVFPSIHTKRRLSVFQGWPGITLSSENWAGLTLKIAIRFCKFPSLLEAWPPKLKWWKLLLDYDWQGRTWAPVWLAQQPCSQRKVSSHIPQIHLLPYSLICPSPYILL